MLESQDICHVDLEFTLQMACSNMQSTSRAIGRLKCTSYNAKAQRSQKKKGRGEAWFELCVNKDVMDLGYRVG